MYTQAQSKKIGGTDHCVSLEVNWGHIKIDVKKQGEGLGIGLNCFGSYPVAGFCEHGNEPSVSRKSFYELTEYPDFKQ